MCQLSVLNLNDKSLNSMATVLQLLGNSSTSNKDGYGIFTNKYFYKYPGTPASDPSFGKLAFELREEDDIGLILGHVRLATYSYGVKKVCKENSHPFVTKRFLLAHNGSLEPKNDDVLKGLNYKNKIDSEVFALKLQQMASEDKEKDFPTLISECIEGFYGKFAFLIADMDTDYFYAVRGSTANLFISYAEETVVVDEEETKKVKIGYMINTDRTDLVDTTTLLSILYRSSSGRIIKFDSPTLLKENTVFKLNTYEIEEVGKVLETRKPVEVKVYTEEDYTTRWQSRKTSPARELGKEIYLLLDELGLSIEEMEHLFFAMFSTSMLEVKEKSFFEDFIKITKRISNENFSKSKKELWEGICGYSPFALKNYESFELQFPYFLNSFDDLKGTLDILKQEFEAKYAETTN